ncbi:MAG: hypothetical protein AM324_007075 [Candidatus Thorarchaeota archaeon SMTZ1-83]
MASTKKSEQDISGIGLDSVILNYENVVREMRTVIERTTRRR